jgi:hypothetical protein
VASKLIDIADAVVAALKPPTNLGQTFEVRRRIVPVFALTDEGIQLAVIPGGASWSFLSRATLSEDDKIIDIGVFKKLGYTAESPNFETDGPVMLEFVETLVTWLKAHRRHAGFVLMTIENDAIFSLEKLHQDHSFLTVLRLSFKGGS